MDSNIQFRAFRPDDADAVAALIFGLYREDHSIKEMSLDKIQRTFDHLRAHPALGQVVVFDAGGEVAGYSILINFWSNEYGGNILYVDELYIRADHRGRGMGTAFLRRVAAGDFGPAVALQLEVTGGNLEARRLYERLGFSVHKNETLTLDL